MHQVEIIHGAVLGRIHAHRRHHNPIGKFQLAQSVGREHRRRRTVAALRRPGDLRIDCAHEIGRDLFDAPIGHAHAAGQKRERELLERSPGIAPDMLEPGQARLCGTLEAFGLRTPRRFECRQRLGRARAQLLREHLGVFQA